MHHKPHIRLVDTHPESIGRYHHTCLILLPAVLPFLLFFRGETCVVGLRWYSGIVEQCGELTCAPA